MATTEQSFASHAHRPVLTAWAAVFAMLAFALVAIEAVRRPGLLALALLLLTLSVWVLVMISRVYIVRLQDRIILLEMRLRLARLGRDDDFERLSKRQLIALRFAPDAELHGLVDRAIAEKLTGTQIKESIREWLPDRYRT